MDEDVIRAAYASYNARDMDAVLALVCEDVNWANALTGNRIKSRKELREVWSLQWTSLNPMTDPLNIYTDAEGKTVVVVHEVLKETNGRLLVDQKMEHVFTLRDGLIERMDFRTMAQD